VVLSALKRILFLKLSKIKGVHYFENNVRWTYNKEGKNIMTRLFEYILAQDDPFDFIYEALSGTHGVETMKTCTEMYGDISIDYRLHPDDDFERIIEIMVGIMEEWKYD
jgi:hypothetical protein